MRKKRNLVQIAFYSLIFTGLSVFLSGPAIFLPDSLLLLFIGNLLLGFFTAPLSGIELPLVKKKIDEAFGQEEGPKFYPMLSSLCYLTYYVRSMLGKLLGNTLLSFSDSEKLRLLLAYLIFF